MKFVDLFAGLGGFHVALERLGCECVFASEIDDELRRLYLQNFPRMKGKVFGDIRKWKDRIPDHDVLCAGFPCQPFSKSGGQLGTRDETRGTLFHEILEILERKRPTFVLLENVGNFGRHDGGRTWEIVHRRLAELGYDVHGTEHKTPLSVTDWRDVGGTTISRRRVRIPVQSGMRHGLISPHHFGYPQHRERFFVVASLGALPQPPFPRPDAATGMSLGDLAELPSELTHQDKRETALTAQRVACIEHWNKLLQSIPATVDLPSFPLWGDELGARYPFEQSTPWAMPPSILRTYFRPRFPKYTRKAFLLSLLPSYAREEVDSFRHWKVRYIRQNRAWWTAVEPHLPVGWAEELRRFPASLRKLEWNAKGGDRDLWRYVLQFRPSGLRVKRYTSSPALVAMTVTQVPILGPERRFVTRTEGLRLQGFADDHGLPASREAAFRALGNAVHVGVAERLAAHLLSRASATEALPIRSRLTSATA